MSANEATPIAFNPPREALDIVARLRQAGHTAYFCGGAVRDALMGRPPKDFDIATSATPDQVERLFPKTLPVGKAFGVMLVLGSDGSQYEVATFRNDSGYSDGRRPDAVSFSSPEEDAKRRDFTINALFYDPETGRVIDFVGGEADIRAGVIRTVGIAAERFGEDKLRLLRAIRFAARTGFAIETETWSAITAMAMELGAVSRERIAAELEGMLASGASERAFRLLLESGLAATALPELLALPGVEQPPDFHPEGDVWIHTLLLLREFDLALTGREPDITGIGDGGDIDPDRGMGRGDFSREEYAAGIRECWQRFDSFWRVALGWSALLHDIGKPATFTVSDRIRFHDHDRLGAEMAAEILKRLRRSNRLVDAVYDLIRRHIHFSTLRKMRKSKLRRWLAEEAFPAHLELHRLDCAGAHRMLANWHFGLEAWRAELATPAKPEPLLRGGDLIGLGVAPGPAVGRILRAVEDARLEGGVSTREDGLRLAEELLRDGSH